MIITSKIPLYRRILSFGIYDIITKLNPQLPGTDLYAVNWKDIRNKEGNFTFVRETSMPSKIGFLNNEAELVLPIRILDNEPDGLDISDEHRIRYMDDRYYYLGIDVKQPIYTNEFNEKCVDYFIGSFHSLTNSPTSIYSANLSYDLFSLYTDMAPNYFRNTNGIHHEQSLKTSQQYAIHNLNSAADIGFVGETYGSNRQWALDWNNKFATIVSKIKCGLKENRHLKFSDKSSMPWTDGNNHRYVEPVSGYRDAVRFYLGYARTSPGFKPASMNEIGTILNPSDGTASLRNKALGDNCYTWIPIFDGTNVGEAIKRTTREANLDQSHYIFTVKVTINLTSLKKLLSELFTKVLDESSYDIHYKYAEEHPVLETVYGLRIYTPSFYTTAVDTVDGFEIPVSGDINFEHDKYIWKSPKCYKKNSNVQYAIGFEFNYKDQDIQIIDSSMYGMTGKNLINITGEATKNTYAGFSYDGENNPTNGPFLEINSSRIGQGTFAVSEGHIWKNISSGIPIFSSVEYNDDNRLLYKNSIDASNQDVLNSLNESYDNLIKESEEQYVAYVPNGNLQKILNQSKDVKVTIWTFDGSKGIFGTKRGVQDIPTNTWL